jgi:WhiB family transcriptional regulator, redox-sensing transcriptional regulator
MTVHTVPEDPDASWRDNAACLDHPAEWFTGPDEPGDTRRAIDVCSTCPVKQPCLEAALQIDVSADLGIWGGTTPTTRRRIRREQTERGSEVDTDPRTLARAAPVDSRQMPTRELKLFRDEHGDHIDGTGRVIVFEIHGEPPYMLMIDGKLRARTSSVHDAAGLAARFLEDAVARHLPDEQRTFRSQ